MSNTDLATVLKSVLANPAELSVWANSWIPSIQINGLIFKQGKKLRKNWSGRFLPTVFEWFGVWIE